MKQVNSQIGSHIGWLLSALCLVMVTGGTALADDTELFIAGEDNSDINPDSRPNILFILDNSGSMDATALTQQSLWDPSQTVGGCYREDAVYYSYTDDAPSCWSNNWFPKTANRCQASQVAMDDFGVYFGGLLAWREPYSFWFFSIPGSWQPFSSSNRDRDVECQADAGVHGQTSGNFYAADGNDGPWSGSSDSQPAWTYNYYLFDGNYLNWLASDGVVVKSRLDVVKEVTNNLLENLENVNVGLMRFNHSQGGPVVHAMENIETARAAMQAAVNDLDATTWTPLSETLYEAGQYYAGRAVDFGSNSVAASRVGGNYSSNTYQTPIEFGCQKNYIILLTDGEPTEDLHAENRVEALPGFSQSTGSASCSRLPGESSNQGKCLDEMAAYLHNRDLSTEFYGPQNVTTYTIGFAIDLPLLEQTAIRGGGEYFTADDTGTLTSALTKITVSILDQASSFTAPSVPVNAFNRTQNLDDIFVSVFNPSSRVHWPGNVKKYRLENGNLVDVNDVVAVDPDTGFFSTTARSFWSSSVDGDRPPEGGAAEQLPDYNERALYTNIGDDLIPVILDNAATLSPMLGIAEGGAVGDDGWTDLERLVLWMRGLDVFDANDNGSHTDTRRQFGDPLHVRPVPVIYGGTAEDPEMVIFVSTNDGYFHAIDPDDGSELWSFVPERLLNRMSQFYSDQTSATRVYGLDGEITATIVNDDGVAGISGDEQVILTFGMRRGGDAVFALDVTNPASPDLLWEIDSDTSGFESLGQTWSTPQSARVRIGGEVKNVVFFGGGYDPGQDYEIWRTDNMGNAIYMVDITNGDLLWSAGPDSDYLELDEMTHSIPAPLRVSDINGDGLASRLYFGDMGGRVWRIEIRNGESAYDLAEGGVLASLGGAAVAASGGTPTTADLHRFYNQADLVNTVYNGQRFMAVNIGSGYRAHPLDRDIDEHFFSIRDYDVINVRESDTYTAGSQTVFDDLVDVTTDRGINIASSAPGWRFRLDAAPGEKVLGRSLTIDGTITFASFAPGNSATGCTAVAGQNRAYAISLFNADPYFDNDELFIDLNQGGIAPSGETILVTGTDEETGERISKLVTLYGTEPIEMGGVDPISRTYWTQMGAQ